MSDLILKVSSQLILDQNRSELSQNQTSTTTIQPNTTANPGSLLSTLLAGLPPGTIDFGCPARTAWVTTAQAVCIVAMVAAIVFSLTICVATYYKANKYRNERNIQDTEVKCCYFSLIWLEQR